MIFEVLINRQKEKDKQTWAKLYCVAIRPALFEIGAAVAQLLASGR